VLGHPAIPASLLLGGTHRLWRDMRRKLLSSKLARDPPSVAQRWEPRKRIAAVDVVVDPKPVEERNHSFLPFYYFRHYPDAGAFTDVPGFAVLALMATVVASIISIRKRADPGRTSGPTVDANEDGGFVGSAILLTHSSRLKNGPG